MCGSAVGTGGGPDGCGSNDAGVVTGEAKRDADGAGAEELTAGELAARAGCDVTGTLGSELPEAVGAATRGDVDVQALTQKTAPTAIAETQRMGAITKAGCPGRPRRIRFAIRRHW